VWTFGYASPSEPESDRVFFVSVGGDGSLMYARALSPPFRPMVEAVPVEVHHASAHGDEAVASYEAKETSSTPPAPVGIGPVAVDSVAAVAAAVARPEFADFALDHPVFEASAILTREAEDRVAWMISFHTATGYASSAVVDAQTGDVIRASRGGMWCCPTYPEPPMPPEPPQPPTPCCRPEDYAESFSGSFGSSGTFEASFPVFGAQWLQAATVTATVGGEQLLNPEEVTLRVYDGSRHVLGESTLSQGLSVVVDRLVRGEVLSAELSQGGLLLDDVPATIDVSVAYADSPRSLAGVYVYKGYAYAGWSDFYWLHGDDMVAATRATLTIHPNTPLDTMEMVLMDSWGNEVETRTVGGSEPATATIDVPAEFGYSLQIRRPNPTAYFVQDEVPYTLEMEYAPVEYAEYFRHHG
ncbi:MAG TPA: hypothetical protein VHH36_02865, partial [Candidatus Thermoplasmatota archaeon]|nr:hypothetical protein [Candidatus Thermoplasmatota archaeon]